MRLFNQETMRRKQVEAAEKRIAEQQQRGIKNVEAVKRQQKLTMERERREQEAAASTQPTLRVRIETITNYILLNCIEYTGLYIWITKYWIY